MREAFETLRVAQQHVERQRGKQALTVFALPALASKWLNPALGDWLAQCPDGDLRLHATHAAVDFAHSVADFALCFGDQDYPLLEKMQLFQDRVQPVCSPALRDRGDWTQLPLIHVDWGKESQFLPGWHEWFTAADRSPPARRGLTYNLTSLAIDAAVQGRGVLLGQRRLIARELAEGQLVTTGRTGAAAQQTLLRSLPTAHAGKTRRSGVSGLVANPRIYRPNLNPGGDVCWRQAQP